MTCHLATPEFEDDVSEVWDYRASVARRDTEGGVSPRAIEEQLAKAEKRLD